MRHLHWLTDPFNLHPPLSALFPLPLPFPFVNIGFFFFSFFFHATFQTCHEYLNKPLADVLYLHSDELLTRQHAVCHAKLMEKNEWGLDALTVGCTCRKESRQETAHSHPGSFVVCSLGCGGKMFVSTPTRGKSERCWCDLFSSIESVLLLLWCSARWKRGGDSADWRSWSGGGA